MPSGIKPEPFDHIRAILLLLLSLLLRIPFWFAGYGNEEDSWGAVVAAHNTWNTDVLEVSRLPGHPFFEAVLSLLYPVSSPALYNGLSTAFALLCIWFFLRLCHAFGIKNYLIAGSALSFSPLFFVGSIYTIDYVWALAFAMGGAWFLFREKVFLAGIFMGMAIACRITSAALIPLLLGMGWLQFSGNLSTFVSSLWNKKTGYFLLSTLLVSLLCFLPVMYVYGSSFFDYSDQFPYPPAAKVFYKGTLGVWGIPGILALLFLLPSFLKKQSLWWWLLALVHAGIYLRLPQKSAYLLPLAIFTLFYAVLVLNEKKQVFFCALQILSSLILYVGLDNSVRGSAAILPVFEKQVSGQTVFLDLLSGPVYGDYTKRKAKMEFVSSVRKKLKEEKGNLALISGWWYNQLLTENYSSALGKNILPVFYCSCDSMKRLREAGYKIMYLPEQDVYNDLMFANPCTHSLAGAFQE